jgi:hypothetical protein
MDTYKKEIDAVVDQFIKSTPETLQQYARNILTEYPTTDEIPSSLMANLDELSNAKFVLQEHLIAVSTYIALRSPDIKDEDNVGVRVQETVKQLVSNYLYKHKDNEDIDATKHDYYNDRAKLVDVKEEKEEQKAGDEEPAKKISKGGRTPEGKELQKLQLVELNRKYARTAHLAWRNLQYVRAMCYHYFTLNRNKLDHPRQYSDPVNVM